MLLIIILYAIFSAMTYINSALMVTDPYPLIVGMIRALGSGTMLGLYVLAVRPFSVFSIKLSSKQWRWLLGYGLLIHAIGMCGFSYGAQYVSPVTICFLYASAPFITALLQYFLGIEYLADKKIVGLIIGTAGLVPILMHASLLHTSTTKMQYAWFGNLVIFGAMIAFCYGWILFKKLIHTSDVSIQTLNGLAMIIGGVSSAAASLIVYGNFWSNISYSNWFIPLVGAFTLSSLCTYCLYAYLIQRYSPTFISFAGFLEPVFGMIFGILFAGYSISLVHIISFFVLFLGLYIFYRQELLEVRIK